MSDPQPDLPQSETGTEDAVVAKLEPRYLGGWIVLAFFFFLAAYNANMAAIKESPSKRDTYSGEKMELRIVASQRSLRQSTNLPAELKTDDAESTLDTSVSRLVPDTRTNPEAAKLYAAMRIEQGRAVPLENIKILQRSKAPEDQTFFEIYRQTKLTRKEAQALVDKLPNEPFLNQLAKVHAYEKAGSKVARTEIISPAFVIRLGLAVLVGLGLLALSLTAWSVYLSGRKSGKFVPRGLAMEAISLGDADRLAIRAATILFGFGLISAIPSTLGKGSAVTSLQSTLFVGVSIIALILGLNNMTIAGKKVHLKHLGLNGDRFLKNVAWGFVGFLAEIPIVGFLIVVGTSVFRFLPAPSHPASQELMKADSFIKILPIFLFGSIIAPIWEEIVFRGLLFPALSRVRGNLMAGALSSSLLFGIIHPQGPSALLALAGVGFMSCMISYQTRSLVSSITLHMLHNSVILAIGLLIT